MLTINKSKFTITLKTSANAGAKMYCHMDWMLTIGSNTVIYQQVTIAHGGVKIADNVMIGADAKVLPNVRIGSVVKVGANCVVVEDVPDNATVVLPKPRIILK